MDMNPNHQEIVLEGLRSDKRAQRCFWPIRRIHHAYRSYGYATAPIFGWSIGWFNGVGFKRVHQNLFHDCTRTGIY